MHKDEKSFARKMATKIEDVIKTEELEAVAGGEPGCAPHKRPTFSADDPSGFACDD